MDNRTIEVLTDEIMDKLLTALLLYDKNSERAQASIKCCLRLLSHVFDFEKNAREDTIEFLDDIFKLMKDIVVSVHIDKTNVKEFVLGKKERVH